jgi:hypothetical protein
LQQHPLQKLQPIRDASGDLHKTSRNSWPALDSGSRYEGRYTKAMIKFKNMVSFQIGIQFGELTGFSLVTSTLSTTKKYQMIQEIQVKANDRKNCMCIFILVHLRVL